MRKLFSYLICISLISISTLSYADTPDHDIYISIVPYCYHVDRPTQGETINESPKGVGVSIDNWELLTYNNSYGDQTFFMGKAFETKKWKLTNNEIFTRLRLHLGLLYGYEDHFVNLCGITPFIAPTFEIGYEQVSLETMVLPAFDSTVLGFSLRYHF